MSDRFSYDLGASAVTEDLSRTGYEVQHALGSGAGGQVYRALQRSTGQSVAIKVMTLGHLDHALDMRRLERFRREIGFCSTLYHPDIVRLLDSGALQNGSRFAVFEFIPGRTLAELLRDEGMLKVQRARMLMAQMLAPLAYAHASGIAHRDLKPGNVMVTTDGGRDRLKILDFGISISVNSRDEAELARLTQSHEWLGTPLYAAPEQLRGAPTGAKSDLYAWALIFAECLTGRTLVSGNSLLEIMTQQSRPEPHVLPHILANHRLGALLLRVLEKDPARRLGDAELVQSLLDRISMDGLEDGQGYLREVSPVSAQKRLRTSLSETLTDAEPVAQTEQRNVTALCCRVSLVGSGAISGAAQIDALLEDSYHLVSEVMKQFDATPAQSVGGYSLWYFGVAQVREADTRLAVRAALELVNRMETLPRWFGETGLSLVVQIGIHAGPVTVHLTDGPRRVVDGATARVAMDLAALADAGQASGTEPRVLISEDFRQLVARYADLEPQPAGELAPSWRKKPLRAYRLRGESRATGLPGDRAPFVGRGAELDQLLEAWRATATGEGSVVLLEGEPGVGKSRLAAELMLQLDAEGCRAIETRCLPEWHNAALRPLQTLIADLLSVSARADAQAPERVERKLLELGLLAASAVPLFCSWLGVALPEGYSPLAYSPQKQRQLLHASIADFLLATMSRGAALLVEDLHWADPSTLECLDLLVTKSKTRSALTILTTRPERSFTWSDAPRLVHVANLPSEAATQLATSLLHESGSSADELAQMVLRSDGVPLYLEELALALRQRRLPGTSDERPGEQVPFSLRNLLTSRLDGLVQSRAIAQFAAALGREFSLEQLTALQESDDMAVVGDLEELVSARILTKRLRVEGPMYSFRHALIRDAAYESMSADSRRQSHELIAEQLQRKFPKLADAQPDVVAHHYERAGILSKAMSLWHLAAQRASAVSAHVEAMSHVDRALTTRRQLADSPEIDVEEAAMLLTRGAILVATRGYAGAAPDFERIIQLVPPEGSTLPLAFAARWRIWNFNNARCSLAESSRLADELRQLAQAASDSDLSLAAWAAVCLSRFSRGRLAEAVDASRSCASEYELEKHRGLALRYGDDPHVSSTSFEALAELLRGRHELALTRVDETMAIIDELGYPAQKAAMHGQVAWLFLQWGGAGATAPDFGRAAEHAQAAISISQEHGFPFWELYGTLAQQAVRIACGDSSAVHALAACAAMWSSFGLSLGRCWHLTFVGRAHHQAGAWAEASRAFDEALAFCESSDSRYFEAEARRQRAVFLADPSNPDSDLPRAVAECRRGAQDARGIGAHFWELACLVTGIRLSPASESPARAELSSLLQSLPASSAEPPIMREARALVAS